jgi:exonuclease III
MFLVSWNLRIQGLAGRLETVMTALASVRPDIVTLQEVKTDLADAVVARLASAGLEYAHDSKATFEPGPDGVKIYSCLIASRWPISPTDDAWLSSVRENRRNLNRRSRSGLPNTTGPECRAGEHAPSLGPTSDA